jgi:tRNA(Ile)-lysidine synthetase-like protein
MPSSADSAAVVDLVIEQVRSFAEEHQLLTETGRIVVGVSGGPDSVCLVDVLARLVAGGGPELLVVHVDHKIRSDSAADANLVRDLAATLGLRFRLVEVDAPAFAKERGVGLEYAGRILRYRAFAEIVEDRRRGIVATGHTADDSIESLVMHLLRGSGVEGLRGIAPRESLDLARLDVPSVEGAELRLAIVRPLIGVRRAETAAYCRARGLSWQHDPTNDDTTFLRNRVRHHLLPVLRTYNPAIDAALLRTATLLRDEDEWLDRLVSIRARRLLRSVPDGVEIPVEAFRRQPRAAQRRLLRRAAATLAGGSENLDFEAVERARICAAPGGRRRAQLARRVVALRSGDTLKLEREGS